MPIELIVALVIVFVVLAVAVVALQAMLGRRRGGAEPGTEARREALLVEREERLNREQADLDQAGAELAARKAVLAGRERALIEAEAAGELRLAELAEVSPEDARAQVLADASAQAKAEVARLVAEIEDQAVAEAEQRARAVVATSIARVAAQQTAETSVVSVALPSEDFKGRLIGKDGRNIRAFEQVTGATLIIDDSPEVVMVSCFDPRRRDAARRTLTELLADGRVHPARIEEVHQRSIAASDAAAQRAGEDAVAELGITDLAPELVTTLGALTFRTSYGQNVLAHLVESAHLAATLAAELGVDVELCRRAALLHDLGKALIDDERSHALAGAELARRHGEHPDVVHAIEAHHNEVAPTTVEAVLVQAADAISASRPGARRESLEAYVQRAQRLEKIAAAHPGVDRVYAVQAGREVRVMVAPERVSDADSRALARTIANEIQAQLTYPGQIKVIVVRESRATAVAR
jgi:ribonuclease Y